MHSRIINSVVLRGMHGYNAHDIRSKTQKHRHYFKIHSNCFSFYKLHLFGGFVLHVIQKLTYTFYVRFFSNEHIQYR